MTPHRDGSATEHDFPSLHEDPAGGLGIVWLDGRATGGHGAGGASGHGGAGAQMLMAATLAPDGALGPERVIDERVCDCCATASLRAGDSVLVAYRDRGEDEVRDISVVRRLKGEWSPPVTVHADGWKIAGCPVNGPALASGGPAGSPIALAWFTSPESGPSVNVAFSRDGGATFGSPVRVDDGQPMGRVDVAFTPSGVALVSWIERGPEGASFRVRAVQPSGPVTASAIVAAVDAGRAGGFPRLAASGEGVVAAWTSQDGDEMRVKTALLSWEW